MRPMLMIGALILAGVAATHALATPAFPQAVRAGPPQFDDRDVLAEAVASPVRAPANAARDRWRHPAESLTFWGLRPGDVIIDIDPGGGYWTEILAPYLFGYGTYYVALPASPEPEDQKEAAAFRDHLASIN